MDLENGHHYRIDVIRFGRFGIVDIQRESPTGNTKDGRIVEGLRELLGIERCRRSAHCTRPDWVHRETHPPSPSILD